jgi:hypothetical protein
MSHQPHAETFVAKWARVTVNEKAMAQTHFNELCALLDVPAPLSDPSGQTYRFEKPLTKSGGGAGFADVWRQHVFAWEYKGKGKNLADAYRQLQLYKEDLDNPPVLIVSDIENIEIHVVFTGYPTKVYRYTNADLVRVDVREVLRLALSDPERLRPRDTTQSITEQAAASLARVAQMMESRGHTPAQVAPFFMRVLFCLFAEDVGIFPGRILTDIIGNSIYQPQEFAPMATALFESIHRGSYFGAGNKLPVVEGNLFADATAISLTADELQYLNEAAKLDWSQVEPSIFGTLFERSLDPAKRSQLGAHYTSQDDILLVVEPVLLRPLRSKWHALCNQLAPQVAMLAHNDGVGKQIIQRDIERAIYQFTYELSGTKVLDPACGSGNFLYVSLRQLLDLEKEVYAYAIAIGLEPPALSVRPAQFLGIETNAFAAELARVVLSIGYVQWLYTNGFYQRDQAILMPDTIANHDAIMRLDAAGVPSRPAWPFAHVIVGNPPFLGDKKMRGELGDDYVDALRQLYADEVPGGADLVCYWFERARAQLVAGECQRVGLIATQAIRGGANRKVLQRILESGRIFMAWADRDWVLDGAAVRVSMVGFDNGREPTLMLDGREVASIHANLTSANDTTQAVELHENQGLGFIGDQKQGAFEINESTAQMMLDAVNPSGRNNRDVVRPWVNGMDITSRRRQMYIVDFGVQTSLDDAMTYDIPFKYVVDNVKPTRDKDRSESAMNSWWLHARPRPAMREALKSFSRYIITPRVSKYRLYDWLSVDVLADSATVVFARDDDYFFGVLHSRIHELWARSTGTQLREVESGFRYTPSTCFETFPMPWSPRHEPVDDARVVAIATAAQALVAARAAWLNPPDASASELAKRTLTNLYNLNPTWLRECHAALDAAVCAAYGWPADISDSDIIARLLELNQQRASAVQS